MNGRMPSQQGLYDPCFEHDSCGVGFVCHVKGTASHEIVGQGLEVLKRLSHRGATGADPKTGDGAGVLIQIPHQFFAQEGQKMGIRLPEPGAYGTGLIFLPQDSKERARCKEICEGIVREEAQGVLGWRKVPIDDTDIGVTAKKSAPAIEQLFIEKGASLQDQLSFERALYVIRRRIENALLSSGLKERSFFYITNLSSRTFSYKGLLMPSQLERFFIDLRDPAMQSALCLVHSRYSTNTFPTWDLAQPFRILAHNGEINTLRGNRNWMRAKERLLESRLFGDRIEKIKPIIVPGGSDSAAFDNVAELMLLAGRSLPHVMMMLIPSAWEQDAHMDKDVRSFYQYHACLMEPWDGPAAVAVTDGTRIGAALDRNGLRPARYIVTKNDLVVMASEVGVLDIAPGDIASSGRLEPGKIFFIDTGLKRIVDDGELKEYVAHKRPYRQWVEKNIIELSGLSRPGTQHIRRTDIPALLRAFGYTREDLKIILKPMAEQAQEPVGSMGNDIPHAVLSQKNQLLYTYFKQLFAQVTNPAIDSIREELVMSLECYMGPRKNILDETPGHCRKLRLRQPILSNAELEAIRRGKVRGLRAKTISLLFKAKGGRGFMSALERICREASGAIKKNCAFLILSDRGVNKEFAALPALLAVGAVHQHLIKETSRAQIALIVESGEPREVHHFALLFGYGAGAVNPYLAFDALDHCKDAGHLDIDGKTARKNYITAVNKGLLKILSKMGISTLQSYRGAQIFEALGLREDVIERCFAQTTSRIGGIGMDEIAEETLARHRAGFSTRTNKEEYLETGGVYQWKKDGEFHLWNPESIVALQDAARRNDYAAYKEFARRINDQSGHPTTLRSLLEFKKAAPVPIDEVEPVESIVRRFATGAMSFGSISRQTHETIAIALNRLGGRSNTGEGGEDPARFVPLADGGSKRSAVKQVASGRFGVTANYLINADELQIKIAQGAKPGEGGQLPGHKVSGIIAMTRYTTPGVTLISPPPHHDIYSIEDLAQLIFDLKNVNPRARISVKLVSEVGVGTVAAGVAKGKADMILISGGDGGTGASPRSSIRHAGLPWELGLSETHQTLVLNDLRGRVRLQTDGQMRTGRDVAIAALLGAEEYGFSTAALVVLGCVMLRHCHLNNCSVGIATQDQLLEYRFRGDPDHLVHYFRFVAQEVREIMAHAGVRSIDEMIGRTDLLEINDDLRVGKAATVDFSKILYRPEAPKDVATRCVVVQDHGIERVMDRELIDQVNASIERRERTLLRRTIRNTDRTTGAMLSGEVVRRFGEEGLPEDTIHCVFTGVAGQSFGAFLAKGVTFELEGMANDYIGKGISGGKIIVRPWDGVSYEPSKNVIIGNTAFYGAISGEAYISGVAGERFCIRNSGLYGVVEGVGDHCCEYMTGGRVVILGRTGRNFAAGMSGGIAYVYDEDGSFKKRCNLEMVVLEKLARDDQEAVRRLITGHTNYTKSVRGRAILEHFEREMKCFVKVIPVEYKRILEGKSVKNVPGLEEAFDG